MGVIVIIQAREGSSRLPQKVIKPLGSGTALSHCYDACKAATKITNVLVATGSKNKNSNLISYCTQNNIEIIPGSDDDVLSRYVQIAQTYQPKIIVRITADCPLLRSHLIDDCVNEVQYSGLDYCSLGSQYAEGVDVEAFTFDTLMRLENYASTNFSREHVTYEIHQNPEVFSTKKLSGAFDHGHVRLTLDHAEDYEVLASIFSKYENILHQLNYHEMISMLQRDESQLLRLNAHILRNEVMNG